MICLYFLIFLSDIFVSNYIHLYYRACAISHYCHANCFFILMSWLPTYFHDNFPEAKSWIFNVVPYILMAPGIVIAWMISNKLIKKGYSVGSTRKISEGICMLTEAICLVCIGKIIVHLTLEFQIAHLNSNGHFGS